MGRGIYRGAAGAAAAAALALGIAACGGGGGDGESAKGAKTSLTLTVGSAVGLSGDLSSLGKPDDTAARLGAKYAQDSAKKAGLDIKVKVATEDTQGQPTAAAEAATKLIQSEDADVLIGPASTAETIPMTQSAGVPNQVPQITMASSPLITNVKDSGYLFRTVPSDMSEAKILVKLVQRELGAHATLNLGSRNDAAGSAFLSVFEREWKAGGGGVGQAVKWNPDQPSYDSEAQRLASGHPDGWMIYDFEGTWQKFEPALVRTGEWDPAKTFGGDPLGSLSTDLARNAAGMRGLFIGAKPGPGLAAYNELWKQYTDIDQVYAEPQTFDAVNLAVLAAIRGGSADGATIAKNLRPVSGPGGEEFGWQQLPQAMKAAAGGKDIDYKGASGAIDFDANGDISSAFYTIWQWRKDGTLKITGSVGGDVG